MDFKTAWHTCQNDLLRARPRYPAQRSKIMVSCYLTGTFYFASGSHNIMTGEVVVVVVVLLFYVHGKHLRSCRDGQLT